MKDVIKKLLPWMLVLVLVLCAVAFVRPAEAYAEKGREIRTEQVPVKDRKGVPATVKAGSGLTVPTHFAITYDAAKAFPTTRLTGYEVTLLMLKYTTSNPGYSVDGNGWYIYDAYGPDGTDYYFETDIYTSLVVKTGNNGDNDDFVSLYDSKEKLSPSGEYYFRFNVENEESFDNDYVFDTDAAYTATVNGQPADYIYWREKESDGDLYVYKRVYLNETANTICAIKIDPELVRVQRGTSFQFDLNYYAATIEGATWDVTYESSSLTKIDQSGLLTVASDETASSIRIDVKYIYDSSIYDYAYVELIDDPVAIDSVVMRDRVVNAYKGQSKKIYARVEGTDFHDLEWSVSGNESTGTYISPWYTEYIDGKEYMTGELKVYGYETAAQLVVEARSRWDPTKYATCIVNVKEAEEVTNPVSLTYNKKMVYAAENMTEEEVHLAFLRNITSPLGQGWDDPIDNQWYVYGTTNGLSEYTGLVKKTGAGTSSSHFEIANSNTEMISADNEYYLWFNVYCDSSFYYFDESRGLPYYNITVNGMHPDGENIIAFWGDDIEVYVKLDVTSGPSAYATLRSAYLSLEGKISINFKVQAPDAGYVAKLYYEKADFAQVATVPLNSSHFVSDPQNYDHYLVTYSEVPAKEMTQLLRIKVFDANGDQIPMKTSKGYIDQFDYSVATWCNNKINAASPVERDVMIAKALLNYGHYSQLALKYNDGRDGRPDNMPKAWLAGQMGTVVANTAYDRVTTGGAALGAKTFILVLESDTLIKLLLSRQVNVKIDGVPVTLAPEKDSNGNDVWAAYSSGVAAKRLHELKPIELTEGSNSSTMYYGVLSWANSKLANGTYDDQNLAKAMYLYNAAARSYFNY